MTEKHGEKHERAEPSERNMQAELDEYAAKHPLPEGFAYATSEEMALTLGAQPDEAKAFHARLERLAGASLTVVKDDEHRR